MCIALTRGFPAAWRPKRLLLFDCSEKWKNIPESVYSRLSKNAAVDFTLAFFFFFLNQLLLSLFDLVAETKEAIYTC